MESERKQSSKGSSESRKSSHERKALTSSKSSSSHSSLPPIGHGSPKHSQKFPLESGTLDSKEILNFLEKIQGSLRMNKKLRVGEISQEETGYPSFTLVVMEPEGCKLEEFRVTSSNICKRDTIIMSTVTVIFLKNAQQIKDFKLKINRCQYLVYYNGGDPNEKPFDDFGDSIAGCIWVSIKDLESYAIQTDIIYQKVIKYIRPQFTKFEGKISQLEAKIDFKIGKLETDVSHLKGETSQLKEDVVELKGEIGQLRSQLRDDVGQLKGQIGELNSKIDFITNLLTGNNNRLAD
jgi:hypothetical protein